MSGVIKAIEKAVGIHRGKKRIFLEGGYLIDSGFVGGAQYNIKETDSGLVYELEDGGEFTVTNGKRNGRARPVMDLKGKQIAKVENYDRVRVVINERRISISTTSSDQEIEDRLQRSNDEQYSPVIYDADSDILTLDAEIVAEGVQNLFSFKKSAYKAHTLQLLNLNSPDESYFKTVAMIKTLQPLLVSAPKLRSQFTGPTDHSQKTIKERKAAVHAFVLAMANMGYEFIEDAELFITRGLEFGGATYLNLLDCSELELDRLPNHQQIELDTVFKFVVERNIGTRLKGLAMKVIGGLSLASVGLFHGFGVLDSALHEGIHQSEIPAHLSAAVELEEKYLEVSLRNNSLWNADIEGKQYALAMPLQNVDLSKGAVETEILSAGIPCTGASKSGRSKNKLEFAEAHNSAGSLFFDYLNWVWTCQPSITLIENVVEYANTAGMSIIRATLDWMGYQVEEGKLNGNDFGAIENRTRLCAIGFTKGLKDTDSSFFENFVTPQHPKPACLGDIIDRTIPLDSDMYKPYTYLKNKEKSDIEKGKNFRLQWLDDTAPYIGVVGRGYAKARSTEPFYINPSNPDLVRLLTKFEHATAKTIPHQLIEGVESSTLAHEGLGQSVIYNAFVAVGKGLGQVINRFINCEFLWSSSMPKVA